MRLYLTENIEALTGTLNASYGYAITSRRMANGETLFFTIRKPTAQFMRMDPALQRVGHLRFIFAIAQLAQCPLYIRDIAVPLEEMIDALWEAGYDILANLMASNPTAYPATFNAAQVLEFKTRKSL